MEESPTSTEARPPEQITPVKATSKVMPSLSGSEGAMLNNAPESDEASTQIDPAEFKNQAKWVSYTCGLGIGIVFSLWALPLTGAINTVMNGASNCVSTKSQNTYSLMFFIQAIGCILSSAFVGTLGDRWGRKVVLQYSTAGYLTTGFFYMLALETKTVPFFFIGAFTTGITTPVLAHGFAYMSDLNVAIRRKGVPKSKAEELSLFGTAQYGACIYGGLFAGCILTLVLVVIGGESLCFIVSVISAIICLVINHFKLLNLPDKKARLDKIKCKHVTPNFAKICKPDNVARQNGFVFGLNGCIILFYVTFYAYFAILPNYTRLRFFPGVSSGTACGSTGDDDDMTNKEKKEQEAEQTEANLLTLLVILLFMILPAFGLIGYKKLQEKAGGTQPGFIVSACIVVIVPIICGIAESYGVFLLGLIFWTASGPMNIYVSRMWYGQAEESDAGQFAAILREDSGFGVLIGVLLFGGFFSAHLESGGMTGPMPGAPLLLGLIPLILAIIFSKYVFSKYGHHDKTKDALVQGTGAAVPKQSSEVSSNSEEV